MMFWALARVSFRAAKIVSCNKNLFFHGLRSKLPQLKTNYNFIKIDLNFHATLASPSFELATLGIESKTLNPTATEAYTINKALNCAFILQI
jgi:hypothetical protein